MAIPILIQKLKFQYTKILNMYIICSMNVYRGVVYG